MVQKLIVVACAMLIYGSQSGSVIAAKEVPSNVVISDSFGYEVLIAKMEYLEDKLVRQQLEIKELIDQIGKSQNEKMSQQNEMFEQRLKASDESVKQQYQLMMGKQNRIEKNIEGVVIPKLNELSDKILKLESGNEQRYEKTKAEMNKQNEQTEISSALTSVKESVSENFNMVLDDLKLVKSRVKALPLSSCSEEPTKKSGSYWLKPFDEEDSIEGYCEQEKFGGGWLVIQHRFDGSVNFFRNWTDYKNGFGSPNGEFWLGLETLHRLTKEKNHTLIVEVEDFNGKYGYGKYDRFEIGSEGEHYALKQLGSYSGTAGDSLRFHEGMKFSTADKDNDTYEGSCASMGNGAWWYSRCFESNLNGPYVDKETSKSNSWYHLNNRYRGLKMTRMMIKAI